MKTSETEKAYGLLWRIIGTDKRVHKARRLLLRQINRDGQRRGIEYANKLLGPVSDSEILNTTI